MTLTICLTVVAGLAVAGLVALSGGLLWMLDRDRSAYAQERHRLLRVVIASEDPAAAVAVARMDAIDRRTPPEPKPIHDDRTDVIPVGYGNE